MRAARAKTPGRAAADENAADVVAALIQSHFELGGTQVNINIVDAEELLQAHQRPQDYPDLVVRVTGFSAYFCTLSPELRKFVVERTIAAR